MSATTLLRPDPVRVLAPTTSTAGSSRMRTVVVSLVAAAVAAGGTWGLVSPRESDHEHASGAAAAVGTVDLPDGTMRVDGLVDKQVGHVMAGMSTAEDVPVGMRRLSVNVSLGATDDQVLSYARRDFTVSGPGVKPVAPVDGQLDRGSLTPGMAVSGSLSFDVPKETTALSLRFRDTEPVTLPALPPVAEGEHAAHGGAQPPTVDSPGEAPTVLAPAPGADHHDAPGAPAHDH